jgi:TPR repeat protein
LAQDTQGILSKEEAGDLFSHYTEESLNKAFRSIKHYAELGDAEFQLYLGCYYDETSPSTVVEPNVETAYYWFRKSAEQGNADSQGFVGQYLYEGIGCTQNKEEGLKLLKKAAEQDGTIAQFYLEDLGETW